MSNPETDDVRLARLTNATADLKPPADFADRVMRGVELESVRQEPWLARSVTLGLFAAAAAFAVYMSWGAQATLDSQAISTFDSVEIDL